MSEDPINYSSFDDATVIPALIDKISSNKAGGWSIRLDVPQIAAEQIKQLIGTENSKLYSIGLKAVQDIEKQEKRGPGRPRENDN